MKCFGMLQILVWDTRRAALMQTIDLHSDVIYSLSLNRDGSRLTTTSRDKRLRIIDPRSGKLLQVGEFFEKIFFCIFNFFVDFFFFKLHCKVYTYDIVHQMFFRSSS